MSATLSFEVEDFAGQVRRRAPNVPREARIGELIDRLAQALHLPDVDASGRPVLYGARNRRGDVLNSTDLVGDVIQQDDVLQITKSVTAG